MVELSLNLRDTDVAPVVFITGGARRLGAQTARTFHRAGYRVVIHYRNSQADAEALAAELNGQRPNSAGSVQSTLKDPSEINACADNARHTFGRIDVLINNASAFFPTPWGEIDNDAMRTLLHSNLELPIYLIQALADELREREGAIINLVDIHALRPLAGHVAYTAAKAGLISATRSAALDLAPKVRANAIAPGAILAPEHEGATVEQGLIEQTPLARMGTPEDIARTALFLANSPFITGQVLAVDGGRSLRQ